MSRPGLGVDMKSGVFIGLLASAVAAWPLAALAQSQKFDLDVPPTTVVATLELIVEPSRGAVLLYVAPNYDEAIRFSGPSSIRAIPIFSRTVRFKLVDGAKSFKVKVVGRIDALNGANIHPTRLR
jgi:hypothetical protein